MTFTELQISLQILGLENRVTMSQVKSRQRRLVKQHHPDTSKETDNREIQKINAAYKVVSDYLSGYRYSFSEEEFYIQNPEENIRRQFMDDPVWGGGS